ncbi:MAG: hypothetical protein ACKESB_02315 [Candidatus Hodgkinia cicadicola]
MVALNSLSRLRLSGISNASVAMCGRWRTVNHASAESLESLLELTWFYHSLLLGNCVQLVAVAIKTTIMQTALLTFWASKSKNSKSFTGDSLDAIKAIKKLSEIPS